jgi:hypothetical protein
LIKAGCSKMQFPVCVFLCCFVFVLMLNRCCVVSYIY